MADSEYCRLCHGRCDNCGVCRRNSDRFKPTNDMIKTALEQKGAFTSSAFRTISSDPPKIAVTDRNGDSEVAVRLTSMRFIAEYRDPRSPERRRLEEAAREEIIRSFNLPKERVRDSDIEVEIREGSVELLIRIAGKIVSIAAATIGALCTASKEKSGVIMAMGSAATGAIFGATMGSPLGPVGIGIGGALGYIGGALFGNRNF